MSANLGNLHWRMVKSRVMKEPHRLEGEIDGQLSCWGKGWSGESQENKERLQAEEKGCNNTILGGLCPLPASFEKQRNARGGQDGPEVEFTANGKIV